MTALFRTTLFGKTRMRTAVFRAVFGTALAALSAGLVLSPASALADHDRRDKGRDSAELFLGIASTILIGDALSPTAQDRHSRSRHGRGFEKSHDRGYHRGQASPGYERRERDSYRRGFGASYTSEPIRGGSSRRTRIIENPYPGRPITGISFVGIDHDPVHINDVITYPRKRAISHRGYSLSLYHPSAYLSTRGYVDYISVKAKRKEYFTVTFHYD